MNNDSFTTAPLQPSPWREVTTGGHLTFLVDLFSISAGVLVTTNRRCSVTGPILENRPPVARHLIASVLAVATAAGCSHGASSDPSVIDMYDGSEGKPRPLEQTIDRAQGNCLQNQKTATWFLALTGGLGVAAGSAGIATLGFESQRSKQGAAIASISAGVLAAGFAAAAAGTQTRWNEKHCPEIMGYTNGVFRTRIEEKFGKDATSFEAVMSPPSPRAPDRSGGEEEAAPEAPPPNSSGEERPPESAASPKSADKVSLVGLRQQGE